MSIYASKGLLIYCCTVAGLLGAVLGSFLNCAAWRIAHDEPWWKGRSHCPECGHTLGAADLVPVFSWLLLKGRCRYCGTKIAARYMLTELLFAALTVICLLRFDLTVLCLRNWIFICCLFCLALVDMESYIIPDGCLIISALVWAAAAPLLGMGLAEIGKGLAAGLAYGGGMLLMSLVMDKILRKESLGGGDIKLFAVAGLYLGFIGTLFGMLLACVLGLLCVVIARKGKGERIPFGPAIAAATVIMLFWGGGFINWYLGLLSF